MCQISLSHRKLVTLFTIVPEYIVQAYSFFVDPLLGVASNRLGLESLLLSVVDLRHSKRQF